MSYNVYNAVKSIYDAKGTWTEASKAGDTKKAQSAAESAKKYYQELIDNGYEDVAKKLQGETYEQAKATHDYYAKTGRTKASDYLNSLGQAYGLTAEQISGLTTYDPTTGEMSFGGKNIGKADAFVGGDSYWTDTGVLKTAFDDYVSRSGTVRTKSAFVDQENENLMKKYQEQLAFVKDTNPYETEEGKAILAKYDLSALNARNGELASGSASNGGNIDSFAAANALRQQLAVKAQGNDAVLAQHQQKINNAMSLLEGMGIHIDRVFSQDETSKNNQTARDVQTATVTGVVPDSMAYASNPFFNSDGTLKDMETDYQAIINNAESKLATTTNAAEKADLEATIKYAKQARAYKVQNNPAYAKYRDTLSLYAPEKTESARQFDETTAANDRAIQAEKDMNAANNASKEKIADKEAKNNLDVIKAQKEIEEEDPISADYSDIDPYSVGKDTLETIWEYYGVPNAYRNTNYFISVEDFEKRRNAIKGVPMTIGGVQKHYPHYLNYIAALAAYYSDPKNIDDEVV